MGVPFWDVLFSHKITILVRSIYMKFTDIDLEFVKNYLRIESDYNDDDIEVQLFIDTAKGFVMEQTELTEDELNDVPTANIVYLLMISEQYHNRSVTGDNLKMNPVFEMALKNIRKCSL